MSESKAISMPAHLWEALEQMSSEMGVDANSLMAQAVFTLARLNGYIVPGRGPGAFDAPTRAGSSASAKGPLKPSISMARRPPEPGPEPELEPEPEPHPELDMGPESNPFDHVEVGDEYGMTAEPEPRHQPEPELEPEPALPRGGRPSLVLFVSGRDPYRMTTDDFTIGRGKGCDFVIESNRVSREHCRITREGNDFILEDLKSSNGTFFGQAKEKVLTRRKIKDGDEFILGTEKVRFQVKK